MILVHDLGSHWRICEPFSGLRMLIAASWCTMLFLPHRHGWRQTPIILGASRVPSAITVTFSLCNGIVMSVCEWRLVEIFENRVACNVGWYKLSTSSSGRTSARGDKRFRCCLWSGFPIVFPPTSCSERGRDQSNVGYQLQLMDRKCHPPGYADTRNFGGAHQRLLFLNK